MPRLINADEAKKAFIGNRYGTKAIEYVIDNVPTVEAIPIEWIEKQMAERENYGDFNTAAAIGYLLLRWEKENEQSSISY